jgi:hypothetical protein
MAVPQSTIPGLPSNIFVPSTGNTPAPNTFSTPYKGTPAQPTTTKSIGTAATAPAQTQTTSPQVNTSTQPSQPSQQDLINQQFDPIMSYLDSAASGASGNLNDVLSQAEGDYNANAATAGANNQNAQDQFAQQTSSAGLQNQQTTADTNQLYNELNQGYHQRFGGSSSAGEAASQISAMEQQRQSGANQRQYNQTVQQIMTQSQAVTRNYQASILQLQQAEQAAKNQAQAAYQNTINQINQERAQTQSAKATANLNALQDLRNNLYQISSQSGQYQQALQSQTATSQQALSQYAQQVGSATQAGSSALNQYASIGAPTSNLQVAPTGNSSGATSQLTGQITNQQQGQTILGYDANGNPIYAS